MSGVVDIPGLLEQIRDTHNTVKYEDNYEDVAGLLEEAFNTVKWKIDDEIEDVFLHVDSILNSSKSMKEKLEEVSQETYDAFELIENVERIRLD